MSNADEMDYTAAVMEIILKAISLANSPMLTEIEAGDRARDWMEALAPIVPENRLNDAYLRAFADHNSAFPMSAYEVNLAWQNIAAEEAARRAAEQVKPANPPDCRRCLGTGIEQIYDVDGTIRGARAGAACQHQAIVEGEGIFVHIEHLKAMAVPRLVASSG